MNEERPSTTPGTPAPPAPREALNGSSDIAASNCRELPCPPRHNSITRWLYPALAYALLIPACLADPLHAKWARNVADLLGHTVNTLFIVATFIIVCVTGYRRRGTAGVGLAWWSLDLGIAVALLADIWKPIFNAPRPQHPGIPANGFPSGHTVLAFALAFLVTEIDPRLGFIWYAIATAIAWSRVEDLAHYPYQVIAGAPMGVLIAWAVTHLIGGILFPRCLSWRKRRA